jgi:predicted nuclease of restriction endonuclease-like RecB superfamily
MKTKIERGCLAIYRGVERLGLIYKSIIKFKERCMKMIPFGREAQKYHRMIESEIEEELRDMGIKKEPPLLNQSSYVLRPDFVLEKGGKTFIIENKDKIEPNDVALIKGMVSGFDAHAIIISHEEPDEKTSLLASKLDIQLISGSPKEAVRKVKEIVAIV